MIQPDRKFVRRLRRQTRAAVRTNPVLRRRRRKAPSLWRRHLTWPALRFVVPFFAFFTTCTNPSLSNLLPLAMLWTLCVTLSRAQQITNALHSPVALWVFYQLPVSDHAVARHQQTVILRSSLWLGLDWLGLTLGFALQQSTVSAWALVFLAPPVQWGVALAVALLLVRFWPRLPYGVGLSLGWFALIIGTQLQANAYFRETFYLPLLAALHWLTPAGWLSWALYAVLQGWYLGWLILCGVGLAAVLGLRPLSRMLQQRFKLNPVFGYDAVATDSKLPDTVSGALPAETLPETAPPPPLPSAPVRVMSPDELALLRQYLSSHLTQAAGLQLFTRGWLERIITRALPLRLRTLSDFYRQGNQLSWSRGWLIALGLLVLGRGMQYAAFQPVWIGALTIAALVIFALPIFGGIWPGLDDAGVSSRPIGHHSFLPIGFWETSRLMLSVNALRSLAAFPLVALGVHQGFTSVRLAWPETFWWSLIVTIGVLAIQPLWVLGRFSKTTNDTSARWWFTLCMILAGAGLLLATAVAIGVLAAASPLGSILVWTGLLLYTHSLLLVYGWAHRCGVFDLIARGNPGQT